jgi:hypothetical protein
VTFEGARLGARRCFAAGIVLVPVLDLGFCPRMSETRGAPPSVGYPYIHPPATHSRTIPAATPPRSQILAPSSFLVSSPNQGRRFLSWDLDAVAGFYGNIEGGIGTDFLGIDNHDLVGPQKTNFLLIRGR